MYLKWRKINVKLELEWKDKLGKKVGEKIWKRIRGSVINWCVI